MFSEKSADEKVGKLLDIDLTGSQEAEVKTCSSLNSDKLWKHISLALTWVRLFVQSPNHLFIYQHLHFAAN